MVPPADAGAADDGSEFVKRELFGGAITVDIPRRFVDVSAFRQASVFVCLERPRVCGVCWATRRDVHHVRCCDFFCGDRFRTTRKSFLTLQPTSQSSLRFVSSRARGVCVCVCECATITSCATRAELCPCTLTLHMNANISIACGHADKPPNFQQMQQRPCV
jgi:hypothetical protein